MNFNPDSEGMFSHIPPGIGNRIPNRLDFHQNEPGRTDRILQPAPRCALSCRRKMNPQPLTESRRRADLCLPFSCFACVPMLPPSDTMLAAFRPEPTARTGMNSVPCRYIRSSRTASPESRFFRIVLHMRLHPPALSPINRFRSGQPVQSPPCRKRTRSGRVP